MDPRVVPPLKPAKTSWCLNRDLKRNKLACSSKSYRRKGHADDCFGNGCDNSLSIWGSVIESSSLPKPGFLAALLKEVRSQAHHTDCTLSEHADMHMPSWRSDQSRVYARQGNSGSYAIDPSISISEPFSAMAVSGPVTELPQNLALERILHTYSVSTAPLLSWPEFPTSLLSGPILAAVQGHRTQSEAKSAVNAFVHPRYLSTAGSAPAGLYGKRRTPVDQGVKQKQSITAGTRPYRQIEQLLCLSISVSVSR